MHSGADYRGGERGGRSSGGCRAGGGRERLRASFTPAAGPLAKGAPRADLLACYREVYAGEPFVRVPPEGRLPTTRAVAGSNFCDVAVVADPRTQRGGCLSAIDNLGKGGAAHG